MRRLKAVAKTIPGVNALTKAWNNLRFIGSAGYWEQRYRDGGTSGDGSYGALAAFKADVVNAFVSEHDISSVLELGCGDGHQLTLATYSSYIGLDVSPAAISRCLARFASDPTKSFFLYHPECFHDRGGVFVADCAISLDVIYHLIEDDVYAKYLDHLFGAAQRFVVIYSSDASTSDEHQRGGQRSAPHVRHRPLTADIAQRFPGYTLVRKVPNRYPEQSFASFFIYERRQ